MAAKQLFLPANRAFSSSGLPIAGAVAKLFVSGTVTPANFYSDSSLSVSLGSSITANAAGRFDAAYGDETIPYRLIVETPLGVELDDIDPYYFGSLFGSVIGSSLATVTSIADLEALTGVDGAAANLTHATRGGLFVFDNSNLSARVTADAAQGVYVAPETGSSGASGAWVRQYTGGLVPEWFGALGDGTTNDQAAFDSINALTEILGYAEISLRPGATYLAGKQTASSGGYYQLAEPIIEADGLSHLIVNGNGATIKFNPNLKYGNFNTTTGLPETPVLPYTDISTRADIGWAVYATNTDVVRVSDLTLDGNSAAQTIGGVWGDTGHQCVHTGVQMSGCTTKELNNVTATNFLGDCYQVTESGLTVTSDPRPLLMTNVTGNGAGRNVFSLTGGNAAVLVNPQFHNSGRAPIAGGSFMTTSPASCFDIEAESATIRNVNVYGGSFRQGATGLTAVVSDSGDSADITFHGSEFVGGVWIQKPRVTFSECTLYGYFARLYTDAAAPGDNTLIDNCVVSDGTIGTTPLQNAGVGNLVISGSGAGAGLRVERTTFDVSRLIVDLRSAVTKDVTIIVRINTTYVANQGYVAHVDAGTHHRLKIIDAIATNIPADAYFIEGTVGGTLIDCNLTSGSSKIMWRTWSVGGGGSVGHYDNSDKSKKRISLQRNEGSHGETAAFGAAPPGLRMHSAMPASGSYVIGERVFKEDANANGIGHWKRITTGSGNVLDTDWVAVRDIQQQAAVADAAALTSVDGTAITGGESPTEAEHNALIAEFNKLRIDLEASRTTLNTLIARLETAGILAA